MYGRLLAFVIGVGLLAGLVVPSQQPTVSPAYVADPVPPPKPVRPKPKPLDTIIERSSSGHFETEALVNGQTARFVIDTGASTIVLTKADATRAGIPFRPDLFKVVGRGASGELRGQEVIIRQLSVGPRVAYDQRALVLDDGLEISLLGQSFLGQIGTVTITADRMTLR